MFFVENELESHDLYDHIGPQIMRFYASIETSKRMLHKKICEIANQDSNLKNEIAIKLEKTPFENVDALLNFLIFDSDVGVVIVIDERTEDLNALLNRLRENPEVVELKKYIHEEEVIYQYVPFREGIEETEKITKSKTDLSEIDTIVCPAREEGFQRAFHNENAWWAIRISPSLIPKLKHIAMYETSPISAINWIADIRNIEPYKNTGKYIVYLENKRQTNKIGLSDNPKGEAPQSPRYTTLEKLEKAKVVRDLWL